MFKERRKFPRADIKYRINIICEGTVILGEPLDYTFHTYTDNLSAAGVKVTLEKDIRSASLVNLELYLTSGLPVRCKGIVVWSKKVNPEGTKPDLFSMGIQFIELGEDDQKTIGSIVAGFLADKKGP